MHLDKFLEILGQLVKLVLVHLFRSVAFCWFCEKENFNFIYYLTILATKSLKRRLDPFPIIRVKNSIQNFLRIDTTERHFENVSQCYNVKDQKTYNRFYDLLLNIFPNLTVTLEILMYANICPQSLSLKIISVIRTGR